MLRKRQARGLVDVVPSLGTESDVKLPASSMDQIVMDVSHDCGSRAHALKIRTHDVSHAIDGGKVQNPSMVSLRCVQPSRRASCATSKPILWRYLKQSATVLSAL